MVVLNSLSFCFSVKLLISPLNLNEILAGLINLGCGFFPFITLNISCHSLPVCRVSAEKSAINLLGIPLYIIFWFFFFIFYLFIAVLGLRFCARAPASCGERGPLLIVVRGPVTIVASLVVEHGLQTHRLSSCGSRAQLLHGMWDPPRPGLEPLSPTLASRLSTTVPPGKPIGLFL